MNLPQPLLVTITCEETRRAERSACVQELDAVRSVALSASEKVPPWSGLQRRIPRVPSDHARRVGYLLAMQDDPRERALCEAQMVMYDVHRTRASGGTYLAVFEDNSCAYHKRHDQLNSENVDAAALQADRDHR